MGAVPMGVDSLIHNLPTSFSVLCCSGAAPSSHTDHQVHGHLRPLGRPDKSELFSKFLKALDEESTEVEAELETIEEKIEHLEW